METELNDFISNRMKMTSFYQPVIIKVLIAYGGKATTKELATQCCFVSNVALNDVKDEKHFEKRLKVYPKQVLTKHGIVKVEKNVWTLLLDADESTEELLNNKLKTFKK